MQWPPRCPTKTTGRHTYPLLVHLVSVGTRHYPHPLLSSSSPDSVPPPPFCGATYLSPPFPFAFLTFPFFSPPPSPSVIIILFFPKSLYRHNPEPMATTLPVFPLCHQTPSLLPSLSPAPRTISPFLATLLSAEKRLPPRVVHLGLNGAYLTCPVVLPQWIAEVATSLELREEPEGGGSGKWTSMACGG